MASRFRIDKARNNPARSGVCYECGESITGKYVYFLVQIDEIGSSNDPYCSNACVDGRLERENRSKECALDVTGNPDGEGLRVEACEAKKTKEEVPPPRE